MATETERERLIYPDVVAKTEMGDDNRYFVTATTNNNDTVARVHIYWFIPAAEGEPVLMIEIDDETPDGEVTDDVRVRIRRNDGLIFEGVPSEQEYREG